MKDVRRCFVAGSNNNNNKVATIFIMMMMMMMMNIELVEVVIKIEQCLILRPYTLICVPERHQHSSILAC